MRHILITGGTGYIGSRLVEKLRHKYHVHVLTRQTSDVVPENVEFHQYDGQAESIHAVFKKAPIEVVIHLASKAQYSSSEAEIPEFVRTNIEFGTLLLEVMSAYNCRKFINTSTYWQEFKRENPLPICLYAATKLAFEKIIDYYTLEKSLAAISLRLFDVYGPCDPRPKVFKQIKDAAKGKTKMPLTLGEQVICFSHVDDVCEAYGHCIDLLDRETKAQHCHFDVQGFPHQMRSAFETFCRVQNLEVDLQWGAVPYRKNQIMEPVIYDRLPGWNPKVDIFEGFKEV